MISILFLLALAPFAATKLPDGRLHPNHPPLPSIPKVLVPERTPVDINGTALPPLDTVYYFDQLIDHQNPDLGTFKQRYWYTWEFYEPGGPIILTTPGEGNADGYEGYLTNVTINGLIAQQQKGATVLIEHRFFGESNPYPDLSAKSLQYLTIQQAIDDLEYFASNVKFAFPGGDQVTPKQAPWILIGGSYSGALTSWTMVNKPGLFYAGYSSSGVVEAITDYWQYFEPIRQNMPQNCSADVQAVIAHIDQVFGGDNQTAIDEIKKMFGMDDVVHLDDVAGALRNDLWAWQELQITSGPNMPFYQFCDALETKDGQNAPAEGFGLDHALPAWAGWFQNHTLINLCGDVVGVEDCLGTYDVNQTWWTDTSVNNAGRSWTWMTCKEVGYYQDSAPQGQPTLVSRLLNVSYDERQCQQMFPEAFSNATTAPQVDVTNALYKGWDVTIERLFFANGQKDPWKDATISAEGVNVQSTDLQPIVVSDGIHCSDLGVDSARIDPTIQAVHTRALVSMKEWLAIWNQSTPNSYRRRSEGRGIKPVNAWFKGSGVIGYQ